MNDKEGKLIYLEDMKRIKFYRHGIGVRWGYNARGLRWVILRNRMFGVRFPLDGCGTVEIGFWWAVRFEIIQVHWRSFE